MKISAAKLQVASIEQCEEWLDEIAMTILQVSGMVNLLNGDKREQAEGYLCRLKTMRYSVNYRLGKLNRKKNKRGELNHYIIAEMKSIIGRDAFNECVKKAREQLELSK